jgi:peroxiredoxin
MASPRQFPPTDFSTVGPRVGERFPDILLPDQHGASIDLHAARGQRRALIIFYRSARW